jgi:hercynylcysteine S-oxide lyase
MASLLGLCTLLLLIRTGSYGTYPVEVGKVFREYQEQSEARPDTFVRFQYRTGLLDESREAIAAYLNIALETCQFVPNATTGVDTVLRNIVYEPGDVVIVFAELYPAFANTLHYLSTISRVEVRKIEYKNPVSDDVICDAFESVIKEVREQKKNPKLALFDTINSLPGLRMPFERLTQQCRTHKVLSLIDGAHGVGHIPLNLRQLDPDFFLSNLHKWLYVPRGCAVMYVPERNQHLMKTTFPTSFFYGAEWAKNFSDVGTLDNSRYLCAPAALAWRKRLVWGDKSGEEAIMEYIPQLAREGGRLVAKVLGTEVMENEQGTLGRCNLTNIRLPLSKSELVKEVSDVDAITNWMMRKMTVDHETAVYVYPYHGDWFVRLSAQVYLTLEDFEYAGQRLKETCEAVQKGDWKS